MPPRGRREGENMVVYTKPEYMKDKTVDLNDKKDKKGKKGQCRNCLHTMKVTYGLNMAMGYDEHIPAFITLDDVVIQSSAYTNKVVCDLRESMQKSTPCNRIQNTKLLNHHQHS